MALPETGPSDVGSVALNTRVNVCRGGGAWPLCEEDVDGPAPLLEALLLKWPGPGAARAGAAGAGAGLGEKRSGPSIGGSGS